MEYILTTLAKVGFDWRMGLFNLVNFFVVLFILKKYLFGPLVHTLQERQKKMTQGIENFEKSKSELQMAEQKAQGLIDEAKVEKNKIVAEAHDEAKKQGEHMREKAKSEIDILIQQAKRNIAIDKEEMKESLRRETVELVVAATEKILGEKLDIKKDEAFIADTLKKMK